MSEAIVSFLNQYGIPEELIVFIVSMFPLIESRGAIIIAAVMGMPLVKAFLICFAGNILPIPFILLFIKKIFEIMKKFKWTGSMVEKLEERAMKKSEDVKNKQLVSLFIFVALPLPGTGGWTGALIAALLEMPIKKSFIAIATGVFCAGLIMVVVSYFIPGLFGFNFTV